MMNYWNIYIPFIISIACYSVQPLNLNAVNKDERCTGPGSNLQKNHYYNGKCNCKRNVKGKFCSDCKKNSFHLCADQPDGCLKCQCSKLSRKCHSADLYMDKLSLNFPNKNVYVQLISDDSTIISQMPEESDDFTYVNNLPKLPSSFYWKLPDMFMGDKLTSYGGFLAYQISYDLYTKEISNLTSDPLVIIKGNGLTLSHYARPQLDNNNNPKWYLIPLWEQYWKRAYDESSTIMYQLSNSSLDYRCNRKKRRAKRKHIIRVLTNIDSILIKANDQSFAEKVRLHQVVLTFGTARNSTNQRIYHVEQCTCPNGYDGLSCQYCAKGYKRTYSSKNPLGFACIPCECNGNANQCIQLTGVCMNCQNNSTGDFCERKILHCDQSATQYETADRCVCKARVTGEFCTECKRGYFNKSPDNENVCERCWCSGVTAFCKSTRNKRIKKSIISSFINLQTSYSNSRKLKEAVKYVNGEAVRIGKKSEHFYYWLLPKIITGNMLKCYGGNLGFTIWNVGSCQENATTHKPFVRIEGYGKFGRSRIPQVKYADWKFNPPVSVNSTASYKVNLHESHFVDMYHSKVDRNRFLELISAVKNIKVYIPHCSLMTSVSIKDISLDVLSESMEGGAAEIEHCFCPPGYAGLSCENCAKGYARQDRTYHCKKIY